MLKLIKLELERNNLKSYIIGGCLITLSILGLVYLFAAIPHIDPSDPDVGIFLTYNGISALALIILAACFTILASVMYNKLVIAEYTSKKIYLLFSYPIKKERILAAKLITVFAFTIISAIISGIVIFSVFFLSEGIFQLCEDTLTIQVILRVAILLLLSAVISAALATISLWFGYWKKSATVTMVVGVIIASVFGSIASEIFLAQGSMQLVFVSIITIVTVFLAIFLIMRVSNQIKNTDV